jgi:Skp family chaperone for outer membrane proteins
VPQVEDLLALIEKREGELEAMSPEACRESAALLRDTQSRLATERQRELADEIAREFEARAAAQRSPSPSS